MVGQEYSAVISQQAGRQILQTEMLISTLCIKHKQLEANVIAEVKCHTFTPTNPSTSSDVLNITLQSNPESKQNKMTPGTDKIQYNQNKHAPV